MEDVKYLVKAKCPYNTSNELENVLFFTVESKQSGRVKVEFLDELPQNHIKAYMLIHMINDCLNSLNIPLPQGLPNASWHIRVNSHIKRYLKVKNKLIRIDWYVPGDWINNSALLTMVKYIRNIPETTVYNKVYIRHKEFYQILNPDKVPKWTFVFHKL